MTVAPSGAPRILVYGAGAVGQFVGGALARAGHDVTLLARPALRAALARRPLLIEQPDAATRASNAAAARARGRRDTHDLLGRPCWGWALIVLQ